MSHENESPQVGIETQGSGEVKCKTYHERKTELEAIFISKDAGPDEKQLMNDIINAPNAVALATLSSEVWVSVERRATRMFNEIQVGVAMALFNYDADIGPDACGLDWEDTKTIMGDDFDGQVAATANEIKAGRAEDDQWDFYLPCKEFWSACRYPFVEAVGVMENVRKHYGRNYAKAQKLFKLAESVDAVRENVTYQIAIGQRYYDKQKTEALRALLLVILRYPHWATGNRWILDALKHESGVA